ncbi:MAG: metallophosphoesterase [Blastocatellia bacterium]|nr:metallophosphoesterase [Blastocatellia bacterium]
MRVFALGDPHLSFAKPKPMHIFGEHWRNHADKIKAAWDALGHLGPENNISPEADILILAGDISWAMRDAEAQPDLDWIAALRGHKFIIRGNHDYWWHSLKKVQLAAGPTVEPLQANCVIRERVAFVGTRGWQCPGAESSLDLFDRVQSVEATETQHPQSQEERGYTEQDRKIYEREVGRLRLGLEQARKLESQFDQLVVILHYPPMNSRHEPSGFTALLEEFQADWCVYGHLHGEAIKSAFNGRLGVTRYQLVSADSVNFTPVRLL